MTTELTPEQVSIVKEYEKETKRIRKQIATLENELEMFAMNHDEQYAGYLEHYAAYYDDEPLSIRKWYEASNEWDTLFEEWNKLNREYDEEKPETVQAMEEFEQKTNSRFLYLERVLGA